MSPMQTEMKALARTILGKSVAIDAIGMEIETASPIDLGILDEHMTTLYRDMAVDGESLAKMVLGAEELREAS